MREYNISKEDLELDIKNGKNHDQIAQYHNISRSTLTRLKRKFGIKLSNKIEGLKVDNLKGQFFEKLEVIEYAGTDRWQRAIWWCKCECGLVKKISASHLKGGHTKNCHLCSPSWKGYKQISGTYWNNVIKGANLRKLDILITIEDAWDLYEKQNKKCALTGMNIIFARSRRSENKQTASLDRIDSSKGYTIDNIQWVHKYIQRLKGDMSQKNIKLLSYLIVKNDLNLVSMLENNKDIQDLDLDRYKPRCKVKNLSKEDVIKLRKMYLDGYTSKQLSVIFERTISQILKILSQKSFPKVGDE